MLASIAKAHRIKFGVAPNEFNADNGAMIAIVAERMFKSGMSIPFSECGVNQRYRIDKSLVV